MKDTIREQMLLRKKILEDLEISKKELQLEEEILDKLLKKVRPKINISLSFENRSSKAFHRQHQQTNEARLRRFLEDCKHFGIDLLPEIELCLYKQFLFGTHDQKKNSHNDQSLDHTDEQVSDTFQKIYDRF